MKEKNSKKGLSVAIIVGIIVLLLVAIGDIVVNYVPLKEIFSKNVKYVTEKRSNCYRYWNKGCGI